MRKLARSVAHVNMKKKGYNQINKKSKVDKKANKKSLFSQRWREFIKEG